MAVHAPVSPQAHWLHCYAWNAWIACIHHSTCSCIWHLRYILAKLELAPCKLAGCYECCAVPVAVVAVILA